MRKSIITNNWNNCYICGSTQNLHCHHALHGTANRKQADKYGLIIPLCIYCHTSGNYAVHNNAAVDLKIKQVAQRKFEEIYGHKKYMEIFHRNYL